MHPYCELISVWNCYSLLNKDSTRGGGDHHLDYEERCDGRRQVKELFMAENRDLVVGFHLTESDHPDHRTEGWHAHWFAAGRQRCYVSCFGMNVGMPWCDYVILCTTFKVVMKLGLAKLGRGEQRVKMCELPLPVKAVYKDLDRGTKFSYGQASICLQLLILETCELPQDLVIPKSACLAGCRCLVRDFKRGRCKCKVKKDVFSMEMYKIKLWQQLAQFLRFWDYRKSDYGIRVMDTGEVRIHVKWLKASGYDNVSGFWTTVL
jgi:hypothetical protein